MNTQQTAKDRITRSDNFSVLWKTEGFPGMGSIYAAPHNSLKRHRYRGTPLPLRHFERTGRKGRRLSQFPYDKGRGICCVPNNLPLYCRLLTAGAGLPADGMRPGADSRRSAASTIRPGRRRDGMRLPRRPLHSLRRTPEGSRLR